MSNAVSKIYISFNGWTAKGGHSGFLSVVAHFAKKSSTIQDLPIALPQLSGRYSGEKIAEVVAKILQKFSVRGHQLGAFILDNAHSNNTSVTKLAELFNADGSRIRCSCHILNLISQQVIFGKDKESYNNALSAAADEAAFIETWRLEGPLGVLFAVINYMSHCVYALVFKCVAQ